MKPVRAAVFSDFALWLLRRRRRFRVVGESMIPTLLPGATVFARPAEQCIPGDVVVIRHPSEPDLSIIKRATAIQPDGRIFVTSDNPVPNATDSNHFGAVEPALLRAVVTSVIAE